MGCEVWRGKLDAYADGELSPSEAGELGAHLRTCSSCAVDVLQRVQLKRSVAAAGKRYAASPELRAKIAKSIAAKPSRKPAWLWILAAPAMLVLLLSVAVSFYVSRETARRERLLGELTDLHVATLASANPVDVISTDRHTVKPWFQGKIPFTFNLPELQGTDITLVGGRVTYLQQTPGAQLIYQIRKHQISVFIFPDRGSETEISSSTSIKSFSFNVQSWKQDGLRYFVEGDVNPADIETLSNLLKQAK